MATINISTQKAPKEALYKAASDGVNTALADVAVFQFDGASVPRATLLRMFADRITAAENTKAARLAFHNAIAAERAMEKQAEPLRTSLKMYVQTRFGKGSPQVQAFGFTQAKRVKPSAETTAAAVKKADATRKARHTMGAKQKASIKGTVAAAAPVATPETPSTSPGGVPAPATHTVTPS